MSPSQAQLAFILHYILFCFPFLLQLVFLLTERLLINTYSLLKSYKVMNYQYQDGGEWRVKLEDFVD